jgi:hypothetical protein
VSEAGGSAPEARGPAALGWSPSDRGAFALLVAGACASLAVSVHPWFEATDRTNDAAFYLLCAKSLAAGDGYAYLGRPFSIRPPGWSLLLAPVIAARGMDFQALNLVTSAFGVACVALLFVLARPRLSAAPAFAVSAGVWWNPAFQTWCNQPMSDVPGAALLLGCLVLERWAWRRPSARRDALLGLAIGASALVRSASVLLVPALVVSRLLRRGEGSPRGLDFVRRRLLWVCLVPALVLVPWVVRDRLVRPDPPVDQNLLYSYSTGFWHTDPGDPGSPRRSVGEILERIPARAGLLLPALGRRLAAGEARPVGTAAGALALACVLVVLVRRRETPEVLAVLLLGVLLVYFGFSERLVLPLYLLALPCAALCGQALLRRAMGERLAAAATAAALLALAAADFRFRPGWDAIERRHAAWAGVAADVAAATPEGARLAAPTGWHLSVFLGRPVYSLFFAAKRSGWSGIQQVLEKYQIDYVVVHPIWKSPGLAQALEREEAPATRSGETLMFRVR